MRGKFFIVLRKNYDSSPFTFATPEAAIRILEPSSRRYR